MENRLLIGSHMSISGGMHTAFERGDRIGCATMQVFTKNSNQWSGRAYSAEDVEKYKVAAAKSTISPVVAHASYLINLAATNPATLKRSRAAFIDELQRCAALGILGLIVHPGAHLGSGEADGVRRIAESLDIIHDATAGAAPLSILESTAGQGTTLGWRFEQLRAIIDAVEAPSRMAVCLDTCHVFAAGYDITTEEGWETTMREFDRVVGLSRLAAIHVNDSKRELGSRIDRHDHIGKGRIGLTAFRMLVRDPRLTLVPKILETEKSEDMHEDVENMALLRSLVGPA
ncbi:MAG: deoxyribonuclease IV [Bacteroidota bacterium]